MINCNWRHYCQGCGDLVFEILNESNIFGMATISEHSKQGHIRGDLVDCKKCGRFIHWDIIKDTCWQKETP
jgi:hypothetical protein